MSNKGKYKCKKKIIFKKFKVNYQCQTNDDSE